MCGGWSRNETSFRSPAQLCPLQRKELHGASAIGADHVVVASAIVLMFVSRDTVVKGDFACQATFREQLQRAVHSGKPDLRVALLHQAVQLVGRKVLARFQERPQDGVSLRGVLQPHLLQVSIEKMLRFPQ